MMKMTVSCKCDTIPEKPMSRMTAGMYSSDSCEWSTPQYLFDELDREFGFTLDVCASAGNAKCAEYYSKSDNGLIQEWKGVCWMNPPYGRVIGDWIKKAAETAIGGGGCRMFSPCSHGCALVAAICNAGIRNPIDRRSREVRRLEQQCAVSIGDLNLRNTALSCVPERGHKGMVIL